jgi:hypothetical protein
MAAAAESSIEGESGVKIGKYSTRSRQSAPFWLLTALLLLSPPVHTQEREASTVRDVVGFETDVFPILSEGYHISVWYGFTHIRLRPIAAKDRVPQFAVQDGFKDNIVKSYALMADLFIEPDFGGFWVGAGLQYWDATVSLDGAPGSADYTNIILSIDGGYLLRIWDNLYISPAVGVHIRLAGAREVDVEGNIFTPGMVVPDFFIGLGWHF